MPHHWPNQARRGRVAALYGGGAPPGMGGYDPECADAYGEPGPLGPPGYGGALPPCTVSGGGTMVSGGVAAGAEAAGGGAASSGAACGGGAGEAGAGACVAGTQNCHPAGGGGQFGSGVHPGGGTQPSGCSGQPGGGLNFQLIGVTPFIEG
jgi:hypothetical protein